DVKPARVAGERDLEREFDAIYRALESQQDWSERTAALKRVQALALGAREAGTGAALAQRAARLRERLGAQACRALFALAVACGPGLEPVSLALLPVLLKVALVAIAVVGESASQCARAMVQECPTPGMLALLLEQVAARGGAHRWRCAQALLRALQVYPPDVLE
ncbi:unnamed protein product, partial [Prorocentrum cordatum]